ncbi:DUF2059 domain-containing protein [Jannaschia sp. LMIT008]|uniref:DUF2059 domain-containing protein n=1 Tax=Jannaschia maritima TaxID=3032585 RepID=UPI0028111C65|nr:DUF2059 domain-containing protein [Jannaschia sp. LMIT008]
MKIRRFAGLALACAMTCVGPVAVAGEGGATTAGLERPAGRVADLVHAARLSDLIGVIATEGARHGIGLERSLFPGQGGAAWAATVADIQAPDRLVGLVAHAIDAELRGPESAAALAFLRTDLGRKITGAEIASREAMLDRDVEQAAQVAAGRIDRDRDDHAALVDRIIDRLDLVSSNVSGGLNANFAFYRGLGDGGAMRERLTEGEILAMVWDQEPEVRDATSRWLTAYLTMAYSELTQDELRRYLAYLGTDAGRRYNAALFAGFGAVFEVTSYELGRAAARFMASSEI